MRTSRGSAGLKAESELPIVRDSPSLKEMDGIRILPEFITLSLLLPSPSFEISIEMGQILDCCTKYLIFCIFIFQHNILKKPLRKCLYTKSFSISTPTLSRENNRQSVYSTSACLPLLLYLKIPWEGECCPPAGHCGRNERERWTDRSCVCNADSKIAAERIQWYKN